MAAERMAKESDSEDARRERLKEELGRLLQRGLSQLEVAQKVGVQPQYLSDVKTGRRAISELFARRLAERLGLDYQWLMKGKRVRVAPIIGAVSVPVLNSPCVGNPMESDDWDGSCVDLAGPAAVAARGARNSYALRLPLGALGFRKGALLLACQGANAGGELSVLDAAGSLLLARREEGQPESWRAVLTDEKVARGAQVVGRILGVIWAPM